MPCAHRVDVDHHLSCVSGSGIVTFEELADCERALAADPCFDPTFPFLLDLRGVEDVRLTAVQMQSLAVASPVGRSTRRAIVADRPVVFGVGRMYEVVRENRIGTDVVRVCRTLEEAGNWLGIDVIRQSLG